MIGVSKVFNTFDSICRSQEINNNKRRPQMMQSDQLLKGKFNHFSFLNGKNTFSFIYIYTIFLLPQFY